MTRHVPYFWLKPFHFSCECFFTKEVSYEYLKVENTYTQLNGTTAGEAGAHPLGAGAWAVPARPAQPAPAVQPRQDGRNPPQKFSGSWLLQK